MSKVLASRLCLEVKFTAFSVAQKAKAGILPKQDVNDLVGQASELMVEDENHPLLIAVLRFADGYFEHRRSGAMVYELGVELANAIDRLNMPEPPDQGRADIYG
ncbi:MAG: hypothetical protein AAF582_00060 [Pseudomonadota bacterium]